jgi:hypothetical protein
MPGTRIVSNCAVLCDRLAPDYARRRIADESKVKPYRCRFIDTTTASPWRECYAPAHPLTRSESKRWKMELLDVMSREFKLVTGCETRHAASVPYLHYFEGMLSLGPYRVKDAGRRVADVVDEVPDQVAKFQTGPYYRLPLWELVNHDCTVAQWYWGDYNNKLPKVSNRRDLFNALYGTPPMFLFVRKVWEQNRERFAKGRQTAAPVARAAGKFPCRSLCRGSRKGRVGVPAKARGRRSDRGRRAGQMHGRIPQERGKSCRLPRQNR